MSHTRQISDDYAFRNYVSTNDYIVDYMLYAGRLNNCSPCRNALGTVGGNNVSISRGNLVHVESELYGITRNLSRSPQLKYHPESPEIIQGRAQPSGFSFNTRGSNQQERVDLTPSHLPTCQLYDIPRFPGVSPKFPQPSCPAPF